jgi:hypothetical protein
MATITAIPSSGSILNVLSPSTWVGGVVPGKDDIAVFPSVGVSTLINFPFNPGYFTGSISESRIIVDATSGFPTSGSFYVISQFTPELVKVNYVSRSSATALDSCSIDPEFSSRVVYRNSGSWPYEIPFRLEDDNRIIPYLHKYELTGSDTWHVGQVQMNFGTSFTIKDQSTIKLDGTTITNPCICPVGGPTGTQGFWYLYILDGATLEITGSTRRLGGILSTNGAGDIHVIISGSANYSSSLLSTSSLAGDTTLKLINSGGFAKGDIVSITEPWDILQYNVISQSGATNLWATGEDKSRNAGVWHNYRIGGFYYTGSWHDEVARIHNVEGDTALIAKLYAKRGSVAQDLGVYSYNDFVETFNETPPVYQGNKRVILTDSLHMNFLSGEKLIISNSVYNVLYNSKYLSQSQFIDFKNGAVASEVFAWDPLMSTGSGINLTGNLREQYLLNQVWSTGSYGGVTCLRLNSSSMTAPSNPQTRLTLMVSGTYLQEYEVEISASVIRDLTGTYDASSIVGLYVGGTPYARNTYPLLSLDNGVWEVGNLYVVFGNSLYHTFAGSTGRNGRIKWNNSDYWNVNEFQITPFTNSGQSFTMKLSKKDNIVRSYLNGFQTCEKVENFPPAPLFTSLSRYAAIFSIDIKEWKQLLILDTDEDVNVGEEIIEGGLIYNHNSNHIVKFLANTIKDARGYKNLIWDWHYKKGKTSFLPYQHSAVTTTSNVPSVTTNFSPIASGWANPLIYQQSGVGGGYASLAGGGTGSFVTYDLTQPTTFDAFAFIYGLENRNENGNGIQSNGSGSQLLGVRLDVSNDGKNWTTIRSASNDLRFFAGISALRRYSLGSPTTSRFIRLYMNGSTVSTSNLIRFFGIYNTNGQGNTIELHNASNFSVGDKILFWNEHMSFDLKLKTPDTAFIDWPIIVGVERGVTKNENVIGGLTLYHEITAINGNVITLDRPVEYYHLTEGTLVYKVSRGKVNFKGNHTNYFQLNLVGNNSNTRGNLKIYNANFLDLAEFGAIRFVNHKIHDPVIFEDALFNLQTGDVDGIVGGLLYKNIFILNNGSTSPFMRSYTARSSTISTPHTQYAFNTHNYNRLIRFSYLEGGTLDRVGYNFNIIRGSSTSFPITVLDTNASTFNGSNNILIQFTNNYFDSFRGPVVPSYASNLNLVKNVIYKNNYLNVDTPNLNSNAYNDSISLISNKLEYPILHRKLNNFADSLIGTSGGSYMASFWTGLNTGVYTTHHPDFSKVTPAVIIGSISNNYYIIKNSNYYSVYRGNSFSGDRFNHNYLVLFYNHFRVLEPVTIQLQFSFDYRLDIFNKHITPTDDAIISRGFAGIEFVSPVFTLADEKGKIIENFGRLTSISFTPFTINRTINLEPGLYTFSLDEHTITNSPHVGLKLMDYANMNYNLLSTDINKIISVESNFDIHKIFNSRKPFIDGYTTPNLGGDTVLRPTNNQPPSIIKFRKVKL